MDPFTAIVNLIASLNTLLGKLVDKAPPDAIGQIILQHEARVNALFALLGKLPGPLKSVLTAQPIPDVSTEILPTPPK